MIHDPISLPDQGYDACSANRGRHSCVSKMHAFLKVLPFTAHCLKVQLVAPMAGTATVFALVGHALKDAVATSSHAATFRCAHQHWF